MTLHSILLNFPLRKILFSYLSVCLPVSQILSALTQNLPQFKWGPRYYITNGHSTKVGHILFSRKNKLQEEKSRGSTCFILRLGNGMEFFQFLHESFWHRSITKMLKTFFDSELRIRGDIYSRKSAPSYHFCGARRLLVLYVYGRSLLLDFF
jgi:hypothetical protein